MTSKEVLSYVMYTVFNYDGGLGENYNFTKEDIDKLRINKEAQIIKDNAEIYMEDIKKCHDDIDDVIEYLSDVCSD